jgi:hypothetical protein
MTQAAQGGIFGFALRVALNGDARPVVQGVGEPVMAGLPPDDDAAFEQRSASGTSAVMTMAPRETLSAIQSSAASGVLPTATRSINGVLGTAMALLQTT